MKNIALFSFFIIASIASAQGLEIEWENYISNDDGWFMPASIRQTSDDGFLVVSSFHQGDFNNYEPRDYWTIKTDALGGVEWDDIVGGSKLDAPCCGLTNNNGTHLIGGHTYSEDGDVMPSYESSDIWILKYSADGDILWQKIYGGNNQDFLHDMEHTSDGGYILVGGTISDDGDVGGNNGSRDAWLVKIDSNGNIEWEQNYGKPTFDDGIVGQETADGGFVVGAITRDANNQYDYWILKLDDAGSIQWERNIGGTQRDEISDIKQTLDGGYIIVGRTNSDDGDVPSNYGNSDILVAKLNSSGETQWVRNYGGSGIDKDPYIQITTNQTFLIACNTNSNDGDITNPEGGIWIFELNDEGNIIWSNSYIGNNVGGFEKTSNDGYILVGLNGSWETSNNDNIKLIKFYPYQGSLASIEQEIENIELIVYPNPTYDVINIKSSMTIKSLKFYNEFGAKIKEIDNFDNRSEFNINDFKSGIYILEATLGNGSRLNGKIIKN